MKPYFEPLRNAIKKACILSDGDTSQIARRCRSEKKVLSTICFDSKGYRNHARQERASQGSTTVTVFFSNWTNTTKKLYQPQAYMASNFFMIMYLHTSQSWYTSISPRKTFKLCHTLPTPWILHHVNFFFFPHLKNSFSGCKFNSRSALRSTVFQCLGHIPKEDYKHAFEQWIGKWWD